MERLGGGSSTPSYSNVVSNRSKEASLNNFRKPPEARQRQLALTNQEATIPMKRKGPTGKLGGK